MTGRIFRFQKAIHNNTIQAETLKTRQKNSNQNPGPSMKKALLLPILLLFVLCGHTQNLFGLFAGAQATTAHYAVRDVKQATDYKYGFQAGATLKVPFDVNLFFSPAIFYSLKGYNVKFTQYTYPPDTAAINNNTS